MKRFLYMAPYSFKRGFENNMLSWIIIAVIVLLVFLLIKYREIRHKLSFIAILLLLLFLGLSFWNIYKVNKVDLSTFDGFVQAGKTYFSWLGSIFSNAKAVTTYAIKQDWNIDNITKNNSVKSNIALNGSAVAGK